VLHPATAVVPVATIAFNISSAAINLIIGPVPPYRPAVEKGRISTRGVKYRGDHRELPELISKP
jgi:hypothetical protein